MLSASPAYMLYKFLCISTVTFNTKRIILIKLIRQPHCIYIVLVIKLICVNNKILISKLMLIIDSVFLKDLI